MLAPTVGPVVGGWITDHYSWHWLFLINVIPGVIAVVAAPSCCRAAGPVEPVAEFRRAFAALMAVSLACLEIGLKEAPHSRLDLRRCFGCSRSALSPRRSFIVGRGKPCSRWSISRLFKVRPFSVGCALSFCLGVGLFGSVYLMPVFLAYVRRTARWRSARSCWSPASRSW